MPSNHHADEQKAKLPKTVYQRESVRFKKDFGTDLVCAEKNDPKM